MNEIKRYKNRKLYDVNTSAYTTLKSALDKFLKGEPVVIRDNVSGADITTRLLLQEAINHLDNATAQKVLSIISGIIAEKRETDGLNNVSSDEVSSVQQ